MNNHQEFVVLLHGILRSRTDMMPLSQYLKKHGYKTANILYPSRKKDLPALAEYIAEKIHAAPGYSATQPLNFVTHSMGGLLARHYIEKYKPKNLGRVVMLSPPNTGSEFADELNAHKIWGLPYRSLFGPAGTQLLTTFAHPAIDCDVGIIAGRKNLNPLAPFFIPKDKVGDHDGIVPVERTKLEGMRDHITLPVSHTFMMFNPEVMRQTLAFLKDGKFDHSSGSDTMQTQKAKL